MKQAERCCQAEELVDGLDLTQAGTVSHAVAQAAGLKLVAELVAKIVAVQVVSVMIAAVMVVAVAAAASRHSATATAAAAAPVVIVSAAGLTLALSPGPRAHPEHSHLVQETRILQSYQ